MKKANAQSTSEPAQSGIGGRIEERLNISGVVMELELGDDGVCRDVGW